MSKFCSVVFNIYFVEKDNIDVGIIILRRPISQAQFKPICLPKSSVDPLSSVAYVAGWGIEADPIESNSGIYSNYCGTTIVVHTTTVVYSNRDYLGHYLNNLIPSR